MLILKTKRQVFLQATKKCKKIKNTLINTIVYFYLIDYSEEVIFFRGITFTYIPVLNGRNPLLSLFTGLYKSIGPMVALLIS